MDFGLAGKRAAVAGASAGLGFGCAAALAAEGVKVVMGSRSKDRIEGAAATLSDAAGIEADVSTTDGAAAFIDRAAELLGGLDILITNAGGPPAGGFADTDVDAYADALNLNLMSTVAMVKAGVPHMQKNNWGRIVAITSISVRQPMDQLILSNTARAGATAFLKTAATNVGQYGITVNSLQPGLHRTARLENLGTDLEAAAKGLPTRTLGEAKDFGKVAAFLCSDAAKFITGVAIPIDGGAAQGLQ